MKKLEVFDPAMCCPTGVCGVEVDPVLAQFAADLKWVEAHGVAVARYNLGQEPQAFAANPAVLKEMEAGMDRYLKFDHDFVGRDAVEAEIAAGGPARKLVMFEVDPLPEDPADVIGDEPVWHDGTVVGWITSGGYAHYTGLSLAWGYIPAELAAEGTEGFEIEIIGHRRPARLQTTPALDPSGARMRA